MENFKKDKRALESNKSKSFTLRLLWRQEQKNKNPTSWFPWHMTSPSPMYETLKFWKWNFLYQYRPRVRQRIQ